MDWIFSHHLIVGYSVGELLLFLSEQVVKRGQRRCLARGLAPSLRAISLSEAVCMGIFLSGEKAQCNQYNQITDNWCAGAPYESARPA